MKITVEFDNEDEFEAFKTSGKRTRSKKDEDKAEAAGTAPAPLAPPAGGGAFNPAPGTTFAPPAGGATQQAAGPFAAAAPVVAPEVLALVNRINVRIDGAVASGQATDQVLNWFRGECQKAGVDATNATMEQIKTVLLVKMPVPALEGIAKLMNA